MRHEAELIEVEGETLAADKLMRAGRRLIVLGEIHVKDLALRIGVTVIEVQFNLDLLHFIGRKRNKGNSAVGAQEQQLRAGAGALEVLRGSAVLQPAVKQDRPQVQQHCRNWRCRRCPAES